MGFSTMFPQVHFNNQWWNDDEDDDDEEKEENNNNSNNKNNKEKEKEHLRNAYWVPISVLYTSYLNFTIFELKTIIIRILLKENLAQS